MREDMLGTGRNPNDREFKTVMTGMTPKMMMTKIMIMYIMM